MHSHPSSSFDFIAHALDQAQRALSLLDRRPYSRTYGCFDKNFWHFKTKDFPSASHQMGAEFLARLWSLKDSRNPFHQDPTILNWTLAAMDYTFHIQNSDGSFDEWYPGEHGWAGPTSYICHSLYKAFLTVETHLDTDRRRKYLSGFQKAGHFLILRDEKEVLANHYALYLLSLAEIHALTGENILKEALDKSVEKFFTYTSPEGWALEYDGADFSYALATLNFFAHLHELTALASIENFCGKSFQFLKYFCVFDPSLGAGLGSRSTTHLYPYAFQYWAPKIGVAADMADHLWDIGAFANLRPGDQDDHYFFYRLSEYLDIPTQPDWPGDRRRLPLYNSGNLFVEFPQAGLYIFKKQNLYVVVSGKRGGAFAVYDLHEKRCLTKNMGWVVRDDKGTLHSSLWLDPESQIVATADSLRIQGRSAPVFENYFTPEKFILFRLATQVVTLSSFLAYWFKYFIRKKMITANEFSQHTYKREISIGNDEILVKDSVDHLRHGEKFFWGGVFQTRYVPQSAYYQSSDLKSVPQPIPLTRYGSLFLHQRVTRLNGIEAVCVE